jgi:hypothetical protein
MQALHDVVKAGYVRYIGMSSCYAWQCKFSPFFRLCVILIYMTVWKMQSYAVEHKLTPFITMQNHYNLLYREEEREMMPTLKVGDELYQSTGRYSRHVSTSALGSSHGLHSPAVYSVGPPPLHQTARRATTSQSICIILRSTSALWMLPRQLLRPEVSQWHKLLSRRFSASMSRRRLSA